MKCPQCGSEVQMVGKFSICPEHGPVVPVTAVPAQEAARSPLQQVVLERYALRAAEAMEHAVALKPDDAEIQYELACVKARLGQTDVALAVLDRAVELGWEDADHAAGDVDLRSLQGLPRFQVVLEDMRRKGRPDSGEA